MRRLCKVCGAPIADRTRSKRCSACRLPDPRKCRPTVSFPIRKPADVPLFFVGSHQPSDGRHLEYACYSIHRLEGRLKPVECRAAIGDSGAFTKLDKHGCYPEPPEAYAAKVHRLVSTGVVPFVGVVSEDYMCEPFMLANTCLTVGDHQRLTVQRYDRILAEFIRLFGVRSAADLPFEFIPVLQGWTADDYVHHVAMYGDRLTRGMWVGVGSVCKRQGRVSTVEAILGAIAAARPDLRLHGFGVKLTALQSPVVRRLLYSADSMAWSFAARRHGRDANDIQEAHAFVRKALAPLADGEVVA